KDAPRATGASRVSPAHSAQIGRPVAVADHGARRRVGAGRELLEAVVVVLPRQGDLLDVVLAGGAVGALTHLLDGGDEQADEDGDDGNHHQQLDQREATPTPRRSAGRVEHEPTYLQG